jgi:hypothetical protein
LDLESLVNLVNNVPSPGIRAVRKVKFTDWAYSHMVE